MSKRKETGGNGCPKAISRRQESAIAALACSPTIQAAAKAAGVGETTLHRWLSQPLFLVAYREARTQVVGQALTRSQQLATAAVDSLGELMQDPEQPGGVRVSACRSILEFSIKGVELQDLQARIEALEAVTQAEQEQA